MKLKGIFLILIFFVFSSCSQFYDINDFGSVKISFNLSLLEKNFRSVVNQNIYQVEVFLEGENGEIIQEIKCEKSADSAVTVEFDDIPVNSVIRVGAKIGSEDNQEFVGYSDWKKITAGKNDILLLLKELLYVNFYYGYTLEEEYLSVPVIKGEKLNFPPVPSDEGYIFRFWAYNDVNVARVFDFATPITENMSLFAKWADSEFAGNIEIENTTYNKTSFVTVIPFGSVRTIQGLDNNWNFLDSSVAAKNKGVFIKGRTVELSRPYALSQYEVTQELYQAVMKENPSTCDETSTGYPTAEGEEVSLKPVETLSWYEAIVFCNKLSELCELDPCYSLITSETEDPSTNVDTWGDIPSSENSLSWNIQCDFTKNGYRLPTEAEWEFAARGGNPDATEWGYAYSGAQTSLIGSLKPSETTMDSGMDTVGWYRNNLGGTTSENPPSKDDAGYSTHEVGMKKANSLGIYDMSGNVREFCWDFYNGTISTGSVENPTGPEDGTNHAVRGGDWQKEPGYSVVSYRASMGPTVKYGRTGFRLCRTILQ